jgi:solute carrier family 25 folate transporter 32
MYTHLYIHTHSTKHLPAAGHHLSPIHNMIAASITGICVQIITNPIWVVKTRMILDYTATHPQYHNFWHGLITLYRTEGIRGMYRGFIPGLFGVSHGAVQFMAYEEIKKFVSYQQSTSTPVFSSFDTILMAIISKSIATFTTYPYQLIRSRMQQGHGGGQTIRQCIQT